MGHDHAHGLRDSSRRRLRLVLATTLTVLAVEVVGSLVSGSLALLADAGHMLTDAAGLIVALVAMRLADRPATPERTYGFARFEILAAMLNASVLGIVAVLVLIEAWQRWSQQPAVQPSSMLVFAAVGVAANVFGIAMLRRGAAHSINVRAAYLEVMGDLLGSLAVVVSAAIIALTGWRRADAVASAAVALLIVPRAVSLLREAVDVLLEATPKGISLEDVRRHLLEAPHVVDVHDVHAWTIASGLPVFSAHVVVEPAAIERGESPQILAHLRNCLADNFALEHCTIQLEPIGFSSPEEHQHA